MTPVRARLPVAPQEDLDRRADYQDFCAGRYAEGTQGSVVFAVTDVDLDEEDDDLLLAAGLGLALAGLGYGVRAVPRDQWHTPAACDVFVALSPLVDPSYAPREAWAVAWVLDQVEEWAAAGWLVSYDQVLAGSSLAAHRLARSRPGPTGVLPAGVDPVLFAPPDAAAERTPTAVLTVPWRGEPRDAHRALLALPDEADVAMYGDRPRQAPDELLRWHRPAVSHFATPDLYRRAALAIDDPGPSALRHGVLGRRFFEAAAGGALPVVRGRLGARGPGLTDLPHYRTGSDLARVLRELRADPAGLRERGRRLGETVRTEHSWSARARTFVELLRSARAGTSRPAPRRAVHVYPDYSTHNPYQRMLHARLGTIGAYPAPVADLPAHLARELERPSGPGLLHVHWTTDLLQWAPGPFRAKLVLDRTTDLLRRFKAAGGRLVWTIHNVLPHDARHEWAQVQLARVLVAEADLVHVLSRRTLEEAAQHYRLDPARTVLIPHSSYLGEYPDWVSRDGARRRLGLAPDAKVLVSLGGIRPYKGLDRLLDAFDELAPEEPALRLLVAGRPGPYAGVEELVARCRATAGVIGSFEFVPDDQLQVWLRAADLAVLSHQQVLNSGVFHLAQTFGLPLVGPRRGALADAGPAAYLRLFDPDEPGSLRTTLEAAVRDLVDAPGPAAAARAEAYDAARSAAPDEMAARYAAALAPLLDVELR